MSDSKPVSPFTYGEWQKVSPRHYFMFANDKRMYHVALRDGERPWVVDLTLIGLDSIIRVGDYATLYDAKRAVEARERSLGTIPTLTPDTKRLS